MAIDPFTISAIAGLASGFLSKKPRYDPSQRAQMDIAKGELAYGRSIPGSDPQERATLAQARGLLGQEQQQALAGVLGSLPANATTNTADLMSNLGSSFATERGNQSMQMLLEWYAKRRQAMLNAGQMFGAVGPKRDVQQSNAPQLMGQLAQLYAQQQAMKAGGGVGAQGAEPGRGGPFSEMTQLQLPGTLTPGMQPPQYGGVGTAFNRGLNTNVAAPGGGPFTAPNLGVLSAQYQQPQPTQLAGLGVGPLAAPPMQMPSLQPWRPGERRRRG